MYADDNEPAGTTTVGPQTPETLYIVGVGFDERFNPQGTNQFKCEFNGTVKTGHAFHPCGHAFLLSPLAEEKHHATISTLSCRQWLCNNPKSLSGFLPKGFTPNPLVESQSVTIYTHVVTKTMIAIFHGM